MGIDFHSKTKHVSMNYSSFGVIRRMIAKNFDPEFSKIYDITYEAIVDKKPHDKYIAYIEASNLLHELIKKYLETHNDTETVRMVNFLEMSDCKGELGKRDCRRFMKHLKECYDNGTTDDKHVLELIGCYNEMIPLLEEGSQNGDIHWN